MNKINIGSKLFYMANSLAHGVRPKRYVARFMTQGLTNYPGEDGSADELWYVGREVMNEMQPSFIGCPVVTKKNHSGKSTPENFKNVAVGVVSDIWTDADGWDCVKFIVWDEATQNKIDREGWNVSCAYKPLDSTPGGMLNAVKYDHELTKGEYIHMAIVDAPRQTGARVLFNSLDKIDGNVIMFNSEWKGENRMLKLFINGKIKKNEDKSNTAPPGWGDTVHRMLKHPEIDNPYALAWWMSEQGYKHNEENLMSAYNKMKKNKEGTEMTEEEKKAAEEAEAKKNAEEKEGKEKETEEKKEEATAINADDAMVETPDGDVSLADLISCYQASKKNVEEKPEEKKEEKAEAKKLNMDDEFDGVKVSEMYDAYKATKKNAKEEEKEEEKVNKQETEEEKKAKEEESKKNATAEEENKTEKADMVNHFNSLKTAREEWEVPTGKTVVLSKRERVKINSVTKEY